MSKGVRLHPKLGLNPKLQVCSNCGKETGDILLIGAGDWQFRCNSCGKLLLGSRGMSECTECHHTNLTALGELSEYDHHLTAGLCDDCRKEREEHAAVVAQGGIYWKCKDCHRSGVIKPNADLAKRVREYAHIAPPAPVGAEFSKEDCPVCGPHPVAP